MRRTLFLLIFFTIILSLSLSAQEPVTVYENPVAPRIPEISAQGNSYSAIAKGYGSLFTNPAGFASDEVDFTLVNINPWVYCRPDLLVPFVQNLIGEDQNGAAEDAAETESPELSKYLTILDEQMQKNNGIGFGFNAGISFVGNGLGLGVFSVGEALIEGGSIFEAKADAVVTIGAVGGYSIPFKLGGLELKVGGDVRPMVRLKAPLGPKEIGALLPALMGGGEGSSDPFQQILNSVNSYYGMGLAIDLGAILEIGAFSVGLSVRDLANTQFFYHENTIMDHIENLDDFMGDDEATTTDVKYIIPMEISLGGGFHPDLGGLSALIDPKVHFDLKDPIGVIRDGKTPWTLLNIGAEVKLLKFINIRGGFSQGFPSLGIGLDIPLMNINLAVFTNAIGKHLQDGSMSGVSLEVAMRI